MFVLMDKEREGGRCPGAQPLQGAQPTVRFEDVHFAYDPARPILQGVSFEIPAARRWRWSALGSGKSTLARLLFRFYDIQQGRITIAGQEIRSVTQASVRQAIGIVPQDTVLFNDTVAYNIAYGRTGATQQRWRPPPRRAHPRFHRRHAQGLRHHGGRAGLKLSGGEKQRVAIARTLLKNPPILIFDEGHQRAGFGQRTPSRPSCKALRKTRPRCSLPTASPRWWTRTRFWSWTRAASSSAARMRNCWPRAAATPACGPCNKAMAPPDSPCIWNLEPMKPVPFALTFLSEEHRAQMAEVFEVVYAPDAAQAAAAIAEHGPRVRVALTIGAIGLSPAQIDALPALTLICVLGAGL